MISNHECQNCGGSVTDDFARVFGDDNDVVHSCLECETATAVKNGTAAGLEPRRTVAADGSGRLGGL